MRFGQPSVQGIRFLLAKIFWAFFDGSHFRFVQGIEIRHEGEVVLHLFQMAHVGKHHHHAGEAGGEAQGSHDELRPPEAGGLGTGMVPYFAAAKIIVLLIARVMLKDAPIVILDEVTANADPENEGRLQKAVEALARDKTILMIAYRLKTVRNVDQILVLDGGKIVQKGWHEELDRAARHLCGFCRREKGNRRLEAVIGERRKTVFAKKQRRSFWVLFSEQAFISVDFDGIQNAFLADAEVFRQLPDLGVAVVDDL